MCGYKLNRTPVLPLLYCTLLHTCPTLPAPSLAAHLPYTSCTAP